MLPIISNELDFFLFRLLESYRFFFKESLIDDHAFTIQYLFEQPFVLLAHGNESDPILKYGNKKALELWEMNWGDFTKMPSRLTAEADLQENRNQLLKDVKNKGYSNNYSGIRISKSGQRFFVKNVLVWNILDINKKYLGQAAMFKEWEYQ